MKTSIIIPCFNEHKTILEIIEKVKSLNNFNIELIVIDDFSTDGTRSILESINVTDDFKIIFNNKNYGKGYCIQEGIKKSTGEIIVIQDADLEYNPDDYITLIDPVKMFEADLVIGSRFIAPVYSRVAYFWHKVGNRLITLLFNISNNLTFTDIYSCYVLFKREYIAPDDLITNGWEQQAELLTKLAKKSKIIYEVPISYHGRTYNEGKKIRAHHTIAIIYSIIRFKLFS